jgi:hypothetical protein
MEANCMTRFFRQIAFLLIALGACAAQSEPTTPIGGPSSTALPSLMQCTPVTPDTKVPWIDVAQLPDFTNAYAYFEACSDADYAWTTQSYPNPKYVPERTLEHQGRVKLLL